MSKWTKKAALERMQANQELQKVYEKYPLAKILVESAARVRRYDGYSRICFYYAYKDWLMAAVGTENAMYWVAVKASEDLLPPDASDLGIEGRVVNVDHPPLPGLPNRPEREGNSTVRLAAGSTESKPKYKLYSMAELQDEIIPLERARHAEMRAMLEKLLASQTQEG